MIKPFLVFLNIPQSLRYISRISSVCSLPVLIIKFKLYFKFKDIKLYVGRVNLCIENFRNRIQGKYYLDVDILISLFLR